MRPDNAVGRAGVFESLMLGKSEKFYVQDLCPARRGLCPARRDAGDAPSIGCCTVSDVSVVNRRKIQLREGRIEAALSMKDTGPESASRREGRSQRQ